VRGSFTRVDPSDPGGVRGYDRVLAGGDGVEALRTAVALVAAGLRVAWLHGPPETWEEGWTWGRALASLEAGATPLPPVYCGPPDAPVLVVGEARNDRSTEPGYWLPFTTRYTTMMGEALGRRALLLGWTNAEDAPGDLILGARRVVACGAVAQARVRSLRGEDFWAVPHPASLYRWGAMRPRVEPVELGLSVYVERALRESRREGAA
jgi:hypothetical protein